MQALIEWAGKIRSRLVCLEVVLHREFMVSRRGEDWAFSLTPWARELLEQDLEPVPWEDVQGAAWADKDSYTGIDQLYCPEAEWLSREEIRTLRLMHTLGIGHDLTDDDSLPLIAWAEETRRDSVIVDLIGQGKITARRVGDGWKFDDVLYESSC